MARAKRTTSHAGGRPAPPPPQAPAPADAAGSATVLLLALMMFLAPALGVPHEEMLQDTLKSIIVSFAALAATLVFFWQCPRYGDLRWHAIVCLPLALMAYALGSMAWSHAYLGAVEAIRWFIFSLLAWLGVNTLSRDRLPLLAWGVHAGAVLASLWTALQFWFNFDLFPQGPHPASTFVNRNFFAEFAVCTLPFAGMLLARARHSGHVALLAASSGLVILAILMTGTRAALIALWLQLVLVLPYIAWLYRRQFAFGVWGVRTRWLAAGVLLAMVGGLGLVPTGDPKIAAEERGLSAIERGFTRTRSISVDDSSLGIRMIMWKATGRVIRDRPIFGVGAGAWENKISLYQEENAQLETDYYVHNEFLQLLAEYGLVGWLFLLALGVYLLDAARRTLAGREPQAQAEGPWRCALLCSLMALFVVSNVGFPWRMAATGALFAMCLGALAASDARLATVPRWASTRLAWRPVFSQAAVALTVMALALAGYITQQAAQAEQKIVHATKLALTISASRDPNHPRWNQVKAQMLGLIREGVAINPHYRKITPMVADELARWGDWRDAIWIWESVLSSRPYVVAIMSNIARGYLSLGEEAKAMEYLRRAKEMRPRAMSVRSLEVLLLSRTGKEAEALALARQAIAEGTYDLDLANAAAALAWRARDYQFAAEAMRLRMAGWPETRVQGYVQLGNMYATSAKDPAKAIDAFSRALALLPESQRPGLLRYIPAEYRSPLGLPATAPAPAASAQTSASKG